MVFRSCLGAFIAPVLLASLVMAQTPPADPIVKEGVTVKVADHTWVIPDGNVGLVPNVGIIVGSRATLVIDPGLGRRNGETVLKEVAKVSKNAELYVASTHYHAEHTTGHNAFPASAKYVNSTTQEAEFAEGGLAHVRTISGRSPAMAELLKDATGRKADITYDKSYTLDLGGIRVRMVVVGPTHTRGDTAFFVEGDSVLLAGDVVMNNSFVAATAVSSMRAWLAAFDTLAAFNARTLVPSHGAVGTGTLVGSNRATMLEIQARARALKGQGKSIDETATTVQQEQVAKHAAWGRANGVAAAARAAFNEN